MFQRIWKEFKEGQFFQVLSNPNKVFVKLSKLEATWVVAVWGFHLVEAQPFALQAACSRDRHFLPVFFFVSDGIPLVTFFNPLIKRSYANPPALSFIGPLALMPLMPLALSFIGPVAMLKSQRSMAGDCVLSSTVMVVPKCGKNSPPRKVMMFSQFFPSWAVQAHSSSKRTPLTFKISM